MHRGAVPELMPRHRANAYVGAAKAASRRLHGRVLWSRLTSLLPVGLLVWGCMAWAQAVAPTVRLTAGGHALTAELARTPNERMRGLMHRRMLPPDHGMLFVFEAPERICMWMRDTPLPLSVAFVDARGDILNIANMQPLTLEPHCAAGDALYALEMAQGWFAERGVRAGSRIQGLERLQRQP